MDATIVTTVISVITFVMLSSNKVTWTELEKEMKADKDLQCIRHELQARAKEYIGIALVDDKLMYKDRLVIPRRSAVIPVLLRDFHESVVGGHSGELKTYLDMATE